MPKNFSAAFRAKQRETMIARNADPEYRAKRIAALQASIARKKLDPSWLKMQTHNLWEARLSPNWLPGLRESRKRLQSDPAFMEQQRKNGQRLMAWREKNGDKSTPKMIKQRSINGRNTSIKRRGFVVPKHLNNEYRWLVDSKRFLAAEAAQILGIKVNRQPPIYNPSVRLMNTPQEIIRHTCEVLGITREEFDNPAGARSVSAEARLIVYWLLRKHQDNKVEAVAEMVNRHYSSIVNACTRIARSMDKYSDRLALVVERCKQH